MKDSANLVLPQFLGFSGKLRAVQVTPEKIGESPELAAIMEQYGIAQAGIHQVGLMSPAGDSVALIALIPFAAKSGGTFQGYRIGYWPRERKPVTLYGLPEGFIEVTQENQDVMLSSRFRVRDFLTKDQGTVWPKYLVVQPTLLDKLELIADELERLGKPVRHQGAFRLPHAAVQREGRLPPLRSRQGQPAHVRRRLGHLCRWRWQRRDGRPERRWPGQRWPTPGTSRASPTRSRASTPS